MQDHRLDLDDTQYRLTIDLDEQLAPGPTRYPSKSEAVAALDALCAERGWIASAVYDERRGSIHGGDDYIGSWSIDLDVPDFLTVVGIGDLDTHDFRAAWVRSAGDETLRIPVGYLREGDELLPALDHLELGGNVAVTGRAGSGKSYLLRGMALALAAAYGPDRLGLIFADGFPGATFLGLDLLPHTTGWVMGAANEPDELERLIIWLDGEVSRREMVMRVHRNHSEYRAKYRSQSEQRDTSDWPAVPELVIFFDELGDLLRDRTGLVVELLGRLLKTGPALGLHVVLGGQDLSRASTSGLVDYIGARYCLALSDPAQSIQMIGVDDAARMTSGPLHGKVLRRFGDGDVEQLVALPSQVRVGGPSVSITADAALLDRLAALPDTRVLARRSPALSRPISLADIPGYPRLEPAGGGAKFLLGLLDAPEDDTQIPWVVDLEDEWNLAISGSSSILSRLMVTSAADQGPHAPAFVILDFESGGLAGIAGAPNVAHYQRGTVASDHADVRSSLHRRSQVILAAVKTLVERREAEQGSDPYSRVIVAIAGIGEFLSGVTEAEREDLLTICHRGPAVGVHVVAIGAIDRFFELDDRIRARRIESVEARYGNWLRQRELRIDPETGESTAKGRRARILVPTRRVIEPDRSERGVPVYEKARVPVREVIEEISRHCAVRVPALTGVVAGDTW